MNGKADRLDAIDARLEGLLDEALAAPEAGTELAERVLRATRPLLPRDGTGSGLRLVGGPAGRRRVAGWSAVARSGLALAATLALAVGAAVWVAAVQEDPAGPMSPRSLTELSDPLGALDALATLEAGSGIDYDLTVLSLQVDMMDFRDPWTPADRSLENAALREDLSATMSESVFF